MSQHNEKNPHQHQSPLHDSSEAKPGMDSLAPEDGSHRPAAEPTPPGAQPTAPGSLKAPDTRNEKLNSLEDVRKGSENYALTTNQGVRIADDQNSLRAGSRGPTLLEDFILREKITHFDHERIPERIVHARGSAAHGYFQPYKSLSDITKADFLSDTNKITPVFVRFSTVQGGAGSADTVRDIRGFATKFYTEEGIFDLVGNNTPIFFIQDAHKFPDFVHAVKPEPHWAIPQGQSAHDTFWDYVSLQPETLHNVMWAMSDRGIPRSYRTMEGFGIHTFRLINAEGKATFVRFHWKPLAGKASLVWDEAQKLTGRDPDFHRRELWEAIEAGDFPEYELGFQLIPEEDEFKFDFDLLDQPNLSRKNWCLFSVSAKWCSIVIRITSLLKTNRWLSIQGILSPVWISPTTRYCRGVCSLIPIHKSVVLVGRISMKFRLTARPALTIISSVTACIVWGSTLTRRITNRTRSTITGRAKHRRGRNAAVLNHTRNAWKEIKFASAVHRLANIIPIRVCSG